MTGGRAVYVWRSCVLHIDERLHLVGVELSGTVEPIDWRAVARVEAMADEE